MSIVSTEAFVLRSYKLAENDKIVVLFTKQLGKLRLVAKGARKMKNRFGASLEVFAHLQVMFHHKENRDLLVLDRAEILYSPFEKQTRLRTSYYLFYFAELINEFCPENEKNPAAYKILLNIERAIQGGQNLDYLARFVELQLLHSQGILSSVAFCSKCRRQFESTAAKRYLGVESEIYCARCRTAECVLISAALARSLDHFERGSVDWASTLPGSTLGELGSFSHLLITRFLGKELQSYQFRSKLGQ